MLFAVLEHFNWRKFTLIFEATESRPLQTKLKNRVEEGKTFEMMERHYVRPGNEKCVTETVNLRECDHHYLSELIHQTKDHTRSKCLLLKTKCFIGNFLIFLKERKSYYSIYFSL